MFWTTVEAMVAAADHASPMCLAVVDIDDFKRLNDAYGHDIGDRALCHVAKRLGSGVRETDAVFRIGGEEFVVAMPDTRHEEAVDALERIRASVKRTRMADLPPVTISAGVAVTASSSATTAEALFAIADAALYKAKRAGKNRVLVADG
jgi:diguanylate cyclase (GGDEF)-like protein